LFAQVGNERARGGFDFQGVAAAVSAAGDARVTAAGGITTATEIAELDRIGADAQVGMALYTGRLSLGDAVAAPLAKPVDSQGGGGGRGIWPTVVCDEWGHTLGLVWSTRESLARAIAERRGIYWSRSRQALWEKGATSGNTQELVRVDLDCDRDEVVHETADVLYLALVAVVRGGGTLADVVAELSRRRGAVTRRPMVAKSETAR